MKTLNSCATCQENKCEIRKECPDDTTSTDKRKQVLYEVPTWHWWIQNLSGTTNGAKATKYVQDAKNPITSKIPEETKFIAITANETTPKT